MKFQWKNQNSSGKRQIPAEKKIIPLGNSKSHWEKIKFYWKIPNPMREKNNISVGNPKNSLKT